MSVFILTVYYRQTFATSCNTMESQSAVNGWPHLSRLVMAMDKGLGFGVGEFGIDSSSIVSVLVMRFWFCSSWALAAVRLRRSYTNTC